MTRIFLLSGPVNSGKTTRLAEWAGTNDDVSGILQPKVEGRRYLKELSSGEIRLLEASQESDEGNIISVGNYKFSRQVFNWAQGKLLSAFYKNRKWLIIDEYGKLEINDMGLEPVIGRIFNDLDYYPETKIVLVVRNYLVPQFLNKYDLKSNDVNYLEI